MIQLMKKPRRTALSPRSCTAPISDRRARARKRARRGPTSRARGSNCDREEFAEALAWRRNGLTEEREGKGDVGRREGSAIVAVVEADEDRLPVPIDLLYLYVFICADNNLQLKMATKKKKEKENGRRFRVVVTSTG